MSDNLTEKSHPNFKELLVMYRLATNYYQKKNKARVDQSHYSDTDEDLREIAQEWPKEPDFPPMKSKKTPTTTGDEDEKPPAWDGVEENWDQYVETARKWSIAQKVKKEHSQDREKELYKEQIKKEYSRIVKEELEGATSDSSWMDATSTGRKRA
jgi:hypothetical protein